MIGNDEDIKYREIIRTLNSLQKVTAPPGFETGLMRRINSGNYQERRTFWDNILSPSRLIPSSAAAVAMILVLLFFNLQSDNIENPLSSDPRVREDFILADGVVMNTEVPALEEETISQQETVLETRRLDSSSAVSGILTASASNPDLVINKSGLNFRQINLSEDEKEQLRRLKERIKSFWGKSGSD
jgi:hypothetical protein